MTHERIQSALAIVWILGLAIVTSMTGNLSSVFEGLVLVVVAVGPLAAMWLWWTDPAKAVSPVQTVHGNGTDQRRRR